MNSIAHVCYSISDNSVNVQEKINGDRKYRYPTPVTQWKSNHWCMTSQVIPCRNFYSPSALQESYLGCRFELGSLQEGSTPFLFKTPIRSVTDNLRLYLEYLAGRTTSSFRCCAYLFDWVREQSSLLAFYWPSTHWYLPEMLFISDSNTCQLPAFQ